MTHRNSPPQGPSVFPWASLSVLILESRELRYVFHLEELFVCHHQQKGRFCWLALWRLRDDDSESHSLVSAVVFLKINNFYSRLMLFLNLQHIFHTFTFFEFVTVHIKAYDFARSPTTSDMIFPQTSSYKFPGTFLLSLGSFEFSKLEVSNFSLMSSRISLKKSSVCISYIKESVSVMSNFAFGP